jgi:thiamine biosynthesis lipoprotein
VRWRVADAGSCAARRAQVWLGTLVEIAAEGPMPGIVDAGIDAAFAAIAGVHRALSGHDENSELVRVNRTAWRDPQLVSPALHDVLACSLDLAVHSGGAFDPTVGGELATLGFLPYRGLCAARPTWRDVGLCERVVRFARPLALDFDGIAKGYAVDRAIDALRSAGVVQGCVNAGGDLRVFGPRDEKVLVRTGGAQSVVMPLLTIADGAVATSAYAGQRRSVGRRFATPLIDPRTRLPVMSTRTVCVVAPTCMLADGLTKIVALRGARARRVLARYGASATILSPARGAWRCTRVPCGIAAPGLAA